MKFWRHVPYRVPFAWAVCLLIFFICDSRHIRSLWVGRCNRICIHLYLPNFGSIPVSWTEHKSFCSSQLLLSGPEKDRNRRMQVCLNNSTLRDYTSLFFTWIWANMDVSKATFWRQAEHVTCSWWSTYHLSNAKSIFKWMGPWQKCKNCAG